MAEGGFWFHEDGWRRRLGGIERQRVDTNSTAAFTATIVCAVTRNAGRPASEEFCISQPDTFYGRFGGVARIRFMSKIEQVGSASEGGAAGLWGEEIPGRQEQGYAAAFADKSLHELGMDMKRVAAHVKTHGADAWIVCAGSREILGWFAAQPTPVFAKFGRCEDLPLPGIRVNKIPAIKAAVRRLHGMGHRRIVLMVRQERLKPYPGPFERAFLEELNALGIATGPFHLPDWGGRGRIPPLS